MTTRYATPDEIRIAMQHRHETKRREARRLGLTPGKPDAPPPPEVLESPGVGDHLKDIIAELGFKPWAGCGCESMRKKMNAWGADGCRAHAGEIIVWLTGQAKRAKFSLSAKAAIAWKLGVMSEEAGARKMLEKAVAGGEFRD